MKILSNVLLLILTFTFQNVTAQMEPPTLNHIALYVYNLEKSAEFYNTVIGITPIPEPFHDGKHVWFKIGEHSQLHLIQGASAIQPHDKNSHICFSVPSIEDLIMRLDKNKISYENWAGIKNTIALRLDGVKQIYFTDPDGFWIEINNDKY